MFTSVFFPPAVTIIIYIIIILYVTLEIIPNGCFMSC